jgi:hypothetical protein
MTRWCASAVDMSRLCKRSSRTAASLRAAPRAAAWTRLTGLACLNYQRTLCKLCPFSCFRATVERADNERRAEVWATAHVILLVFAGLITIPPAGDEPEQASCKQYWAQRSQCARGRCDAPAQERLRKECLRDGVPHVR